MGREILTVVQGAPTAFADSTGEMWSADFVFNGGTTGTGAFTPDHQGVLTFTQIPEPGSVMLGLLGGLVLVARRRR